MFQQHTQHNPYPQRSMDEDEDMGVSNSNTAHNNTLYNNNMLIQNQNHSVPRQLVQPRAPVLVRYEVAGNIFEVPERYRLEYAIGQGAYGIVCSAYDSVLNEKVAIKKVFKIFEHDREFQKRILREIKILKHFDHENIICLTDLIPPRNKEEFSDVYIVTDLMETDLRQIIKSDQQLSDQHIQYFIYQILRALKYIHSADILHRDLKPGNILLNSDCELKICDFGLSRGMDFDTQNYSAMSTPYVATRWYRPPELLLMWEYATKAIDVWSVGCIFAELLGRKVLFPGANHLTQLDLIIGVIGSPTEKQIKGCVRGREYMKNLPYKPKQSWQKMFPQASAKALDLLERMLKFDPDERISVEDALAHPYLASMHDVDDEPTCPKFDFSFEDQLGNEDTDESRKLIKEMIYREIMDWNLKENGISGDAIIKGEAPNGVISMKQ